jgi:hypothetical protein
MPRLRRAASAALLLALLAPLLGCGGGKSSTTSPAPLSDAIIVGSVSPAAGTKLPPGGTVNFQVACNYRLVSTATATVMLTITDGMGNILKNGTASTTVMKGEASVPLAATVTVPSSIVLLQVDCALEPNGNSDVLVATVNFPVGN